MQPEENKIQTSLYDHPSVVLTIQTFVLQISSSLQDLDVQTFIDGGGGGTEALVLVIGLGCLGSYRIQDDSVL